MALRCRSCRGGGYCLPVLVVLSLFFGSGVAGPAVSQDSTATGATPANDDPYVIALLVSSPPKGENERVKAIQYGARLRIDAINKAGGIGGKPVRLIILDDRKKSENTIRNVKQALGEKRLIAMVGLNSSTRGSKVIRAIGESGVPFISDISLDRLFAPYPNSFSMTSSISGDTRTFTRFLGENYKRAIFIGREDELFAREFYKALQKQNKVAIDAVHWMPRNSKDFAFATELVIKDIKEKRPDVLGLSVFSFQGAEFVKRLAAAGIHIPVYFVTGSVQSVLQKTRDIDYRAARFGVGRGIPHVEGERLARLVKRAAFKNMRDLFPNYLGNGIIYADLLAMIAAAAGEATEIQTAARNGKAANLSPAEMRRAIVTGLQKFRQGRRVFRGLWRDWSFTKARSSALDAFVLWVPAGSRELKLWPVQHVRTLAGIRPAPVVYANVDLVRIHSINTNAKSFNAEFYLSLSGDQSVDINSMEFSSAIRGDDGAPFLNIREIHKGAAKIALSPRSQTPPRLAGATSHESGPEKENTWVNRLYLIKGQFQFQPELSLYPFDSQRFSVSIQPVNTASPILIQPRPATLRNREPVIDGWTIHKGRLGEYVGSDQDIIRLVRNFGSEQLIMPFYKFNFSWVAKRITKDYYVRVIVPLGLIMMVAYFSVFLPRDRIDSAIAMQVTALLSTIALYFSIPKLETETATLSDQIFVFSEMVIVMMIVLSILRVNIARKGSFLGRTLRGIHIIFFPALVFLMLRYVVAVSAGAIKSLSNETIGSILYQILPKVL